MVCMLSFRKRNPRKPDEKDKLQFVLSPLYSDLIAKNRQTGIPFSSAPLRFRTIQRELGR